MKTKRVTLGKALAVGLVLSFLHTGCGEKSKIQSHLEAGEKYYQAGKYDEAKLEYLNLQRQDPKNAIAYARMGEIWLRQGSPYQAVPYLLEARKLDSDNVQVQFHLAEVSVVLGALVEARKNALEVLEKTPSHDDALVILAETAVGEELVAETRMILEKPELAGSRGAALGLAVLGYRGQNFTAAESGIRQVLEGAADYSKAHLALALVLHSQKKIVEAEEEYRKAAELAPDRSGEKFSYAQFLIQAGKPELAEEYLRGLTVKTPDYLPAWILLTQLAVMEKDYSEAEKLLANVFRRDRAQHEARLFQSQIQIARGEFEEALESLKQLKTLYPHIPVINFRLAVAYLMNANPSRAIEALDHALQLQPNYLEARLLKAKLQLRLGEPKVVVMSMQKLLEQAPEIRQAQMLLVDAYRMQGRLDQAAEIFHSQIEEDSENFQAHLLLGKILRQQGKAEAARASFERAHSIDEGSPLPSIQLAELDLIAGHSDEALARIGEIAARTPDSAIPDFMLGRIHAHQKSWDDAERAFLRAIELEPNFLQAYNLLVQSYVAAEKLPEARAKLEEYIDISPEDASALIQLALVQEELGNLKEAESSYLRAISIVPDFAPGLNNLAWLYIVKLDEPAKALEIAVRARVLMPEEGGIADTLGWIYYKQKDYARAVALLREAASKLPDNPEVSYHYGMTAYMMGQVREARRALTVAAQAEAEFDGQQEARDFLARLDGVGEGSGVPDIAAFQKWVDEHPDDVVALLQLASALEREKNDDAAKRIYEKVRVLNPKQMESALGLARLYHGSLNDSVRATKLAKEARALSPADGRPLAILGSIELAAGRSKPAHSLLSLAIDAGVNEPQVLRDSAWAAYQVGEIRHARGLMQQLVALDSEPGLALDAKVFLALTEPVLVVTPTLVDQANTILVDSPDHLPALLILAAHAETRGELERAEKAYQDILSRFPDFSSAKKELASIYLQRRENLEKAKQLALQARQAKPGDLELSRLLGEISFLLKDYEYSVQLLKEAQEGGKIDSEGLYFLGAAQLSINPDSPEGKAELVKAIELGLPEPLKNEAHARLQDGKR